MIAVLPDKHRFSTPLQTIDISHDDARASLFLQASTLLGLDRARLVTSGLKATSSRGDTLALEDGRLAAEAVEGKENAYRIGAEIEGLFPTEEALGLLDPTGVLPKRVDNLRADAELTFTAPWDRNAVENSRPQLTEVILTDLSARWGDVTFRAAGQVTVDEVGVPEGEITIRAEEWRRMLDMADSAGAVPQALRGTVETALGLLSGGTEVLDAPLVFSGGRIWLGIIPLGTAPRLVIR